MRPLENRGTVNHIQDGGVGFGSRVALAVVGMLTIWPGSTLV